MRDLYNDRMGRIMSQRVIDAFCEIGAMSVLAFGMLWAGRAIVLNKFSIDLLTLVGG